MGMIFVGICLFMIGCVVIALLQHLYNLTKRVAFVVAGYSLAFYYVITQKTVD